ncbi:MULTISPECIES: helix-turn-helix transcriptional regulator [unclassified Anabaena]|uniref:helix-turn-helix domain-containing protein n=1 Tax=unclassified Anabaena TaxID=2619674 RepID=UPI002B1E99AF|nr:helix-turn-helix transcriptional regulator [Anabaena sp. UHCC 0399]MEA5567227.1 helix-turn-helix transcriptional regulator [Anabaena sp. UHCC 0399]
MANNHELLKFGLKIRELRLLKGLSQEDLADLAGLHRTYIGGIERGERNVAFINIVRLAKALDVSLSNLMKGVD